MDKERKDILQKFFVENKGICLGLKTWIDVKSKSFKLIDALNCIYDNADGKFNEMEKIIRQLIDKGKTPMGRTQVYNTPENNPNQIDIKNNGGVLELVNYNPNKEERAKGQKVDRNPKIFRQTDGQINKNYQKTEEHLKNIGYAVRQLFPDVDTSLITLIIQAVRKYASEKKINTNTVLKKIEQKKLVFDTRLNVLCSPMKENKVVIISESMFNELRESDEFKITEYKFNSNIKHFLSELLSDPVNAEPSFLLKQNGLNRNKLINILITNDMLLKSEKISDKDENGDSKTATMKVKYQVPKADFNHKLKKLFIKLFERNTPKKQQSEIIGEDGECGAMGATGADASGAFEQPVFGVQRRQISRNIDETDTCSVGNYQYDVPFIGDKETLSRKNGVGGSVSINKV